VIKVKLQDKEEWIIYVLREKHTYITVSEIAEQVSSSTKTIYRTIKKINDRCTHGELIKTEKGKGIKLNYDVYLESKIDSNTETLYNYSPVERRMNIIQQLLFKSPNTIEEEILFGKYYVSQSVIRVDEEIIGEQLKSKDLILKKEGTKLSVIGLEFSIRKALIDSLLKMNILNFEDLKSINVDFNKDDLEFVFSQIEMIERRLDTTIPSPYNINLLTHLYILINRAGKGIFDLNENYSFFNYVNIIKEEERYYKLAVKVRENIEAYLNTSLPESETMNIFIYLASSRIDKSSETTRVFPKEVHIITDFYINEFQKESNITIMHSLIFNELASHIKPMLNRLKSNISIKNSLIEDIKVEYGKLFNIVLKISGKVSENYKLPIIREDEVGFITLYFARYIEQHPQKIKALILCTTGMGTSELLKVKIMKFFPDIDIQATASIKECSAEFIQNTSVDLILTTVKLQDNLQVPTVLVNTLFIEKDQDNVRKIIKEIIWKRQEKNMLNF
jgi:activator of the mannose operon (transcriptional antiterminator)